MKNTDVNVKELFERLLDLEGKEIEVGFSGGFYFTKTITVDRVQGVKFGEDEKDITVMIDTHGSDFQIKLNEVLEVEYDCKDTFADIVLSFKNHYLHIWVQ
jgi:hypothetical protein